MTGALSHIRVLDLSRVFAGPWAAQMLADFGADVIKVENPRYGDDTRHMGAPLLDGRGEDTGLTSAFLSMNRGKRSIAIDLASDEGQELVKRLTEQCDVLIENFKTGTLARYGLDYETLRLINPRLVYCSITGVGQTGPKRALPGYDAIFQAMSGVMSVTGPADSGPCLIGYSASDINAGLYATIGILTALNHRDRVSGRGQYIDLALLDAQVASMSHLTMHHLVSGKIPGRAGAASQLNAPWQPFDCADRPVMLTIGNQRQFRSLMEVLGKPEVAEDDRYRDNAGRLAHRSDLLAILIPLIAEFQSDDLIDRLTGAGIAASPILDVAQSLAEPHLLARGATVTIDDPLAGPITVLSNPIRLSETPAVYDRPPPRLDAHREEILRDMHASSLQSTGAPRR